MVEAQTARPGRARSPVAKTADAGDLEALAKFHARLLKLETDTSGKDTSGKDMAGQFSGLNVLQIGDSHTAADHFTGRLRSLLQARFGNGGRGFLAPGAPHAWYKPHQVMVAQSAGWKTFSSNKTTPDAGHFGLSGFIAEARTADETITIEDRSGADTLVVGYIRRPDGGSFNVHVDGQPAGIVETRGPNDEHASVTQSLVPANVAPGTVRRIEIKTVGTGPVSLTDVALTRAKGVRFVNLGFIGAQVSIMGRWHWPFVREQLAALDPALIILAFGTNEGHAPVGNIEARYARQLEERIVALKAAAPNASIVVVGTPDANRYPKFCLPLPIQPAAPAEPAISAPGTEAAPAPLAASPPSPPSPAIGPAKAKSKIAKRQPPPPPEPPADAVCLPLDRFERAAYEQMLADKDRRLCRWHTLPAIPVVRTVQREVAARTGALFFDWFEMFEGECGADRWYGRGLAQKDRVHFKQAGYWLAADKLHARLLAGYTSSKR